MIARPLVRLFLAPIEDLAACLERQLLLGGSRPAAALLLVVGAVVAWWIYFPVHELLHAAGCVLTGGEVTELRIPSRYGGAWIAGVLPFVTATEGGTGRLSGFDTGGSDLVYLATDVAPYLLSILVGVPLLRWTTHVRRPFLAGAALLLALAPLLNLFGDDYEMGSILVTRGASAAGVAPLEELRPLRSDDVFGLIDGWEQAPPTSRDAALVGMSFVVGVLLAFGMYALGGWWSRRLGIETALAPSTQGDGGGGGADAGRGADGTAAAAGRGARSPDDDPGPGGPGTGSTRPG